MLGAVVTEENIVASLGTDADNPAAIVSTARRHALKGTLKAIKGYAAGALCPCQRATTAGFGI